MEKSYNIEGFVLKGDVSDSNPYIALDNETTYETKHFVFNGAYVDAVVRLRSLGLQAVSLIHYLSPCMVMP